MVSVPGVGSSSGSNSGRPSRRMSRSSVSAPASTAPASAVSSAERLRDCIASDPPSPTICNGLNVSGAQHRVNEQPDERKDQHEDRPAGLAAARQVVPAEDVDHGPRPEDEEEDDDGEDRDQE